jgi:hypothetical protein
MWLLGKNHDYSSDCSEEELIAEIRSFPPSKFCLEAMDDQGIFEDSLLNDPEGCEPIDQDLLDWTMTLSPVRGSVRWLLWISKDWSVVATFQDIAYGSAARPG